MQLNVTDIYRYSNDISHLKIVGSYSINGDIQYCNDLSQLKYYREPLDIRNVNFNLDKNEDTTYHPENLVWKPDFLLRWISENFDLLKAKKSYNSKRWLEPDFICYRGVLKTLLLTPHEKWNGWIICASKFKGTIYLCYFHTDEKKRQIINKTAYEKRSEAWGYKFEQFMVSSSPYSNPDLSVPLNHNNEFCCIFKSKFVDKTLLYAAEIDGIRSNQIIKDTIVNKDLELIELKTIFYKNLSYQQIGCNRMLTWWAQSYLVGIKDIICGGKNNIGVVRNIQKFKIDYFNHFISDHQEKSKSFFTKFLECMKTIITEEYDECLYKFTHKPKENIITVEKIKPSSELEYTFLHPWFIQKTKDHFEKF